MAHGFSLPGSAEPPNRQTRQVLGQHKTGHQKYFLKEFHISYFILIYILHLSDSALCLGPTACCFLGHRTCPSSFSLSGLSMSRLRCWRAQRTKTPITQMSDTALYVHHPCQGVVMPLQQMRNWGLENDTHTCPRPQLVMGESSLL